AAMEKGHEATIAIRPTEARPSSTSSPDPVTRIRPLSGTTDEPSFIHMGLASTKHSFLAVTRKNPNRILFQPRWTSLVRSDPERWVLRTTGGRRNTPGTALTTAITSETR